MTDIIQTEQPLELDPTGDVWLKHGRASTILTELAESIDRYALSRLFSVVEVDDAETGDLLYNVAILEQPPREWGVLIGDILHNLRSSLDLLAEQAIVFAGGTPTKQTGFPIGEDKKALDKLMDSRLEGASPRCHRLVRALRPYREGCEQLWWLHRLNIADKHHLLVPVGAASRSVALNLTMNVPWSDTPVETPPIALRPADRRFPLQSGDTLFKISAAARSDGSPVMRPTFAFDLAFGSTDVVDGAPIIETLQGIASTVGRITTLFDKYVFRSAE